MKILTKWLRAYLPELNVDDAQLAEDLTLRGIAVEGIYDLGAGKGSLYEMDITTNRVDAMNHYGVAREAAAIYGLTLPALNFVLPEAQSVSAPFSVRIEAQDACGRFTVLPSLPRAIGLLALRWPHTSACWSRSKSPTPWTPPTLHGF